MLRDEAHRFAISFHRKKKRRKDIEVSLLRKRGIGPATLKRLLDYFGSFEAIERAGYEELKGVVGVKIADILTQETENEER
jgi:excinuclease ABC subunit C